MNEILEKAARAYWDAGLPSSVGWLTLHPATKKDVLGGMRAAMEAMREPIGPQYEAAYDTGIPLSQNDIEAIWGAMMGVLLSEDA